MTDQYLVVGCPGLVARAVVRAIERDVPDARLHVFVEPSSHGRALEDLSEKGSTVRHWRGNVESVDLGLSGADYLELARSVTHVIWCVEPWIAPGKSLERARAVRSASELVEFLRASKSLKSAVYLSSIFALGNASGEVDENELYLGQKFDDQFEEACAVAERVVERALTQFPLTIGRAAPVLGDSETGECPEHGAMVRLVQVLRGGPGHVGASFSGQPVHFVAADWLASALVKLSQNPGARGRRVHLVDPAPISDHRFLHLVADACERQVEERPVTGVRGRAQSPLTRLTTQEAKAFRGWPLRLRTSTSDELLGELPAPRVDDYLPRLVDWCRGERRGGLV